MGFSSSEGLAWRPVRLSRASARGQGEGDMQIAVASVEIEAQALAVALEGFGGGSTRRAAPAELRQAFLIESHDRMPGDRAAGGSLDDAALGLVEDQ